MYYLTKYFKEKKVYPLIDDAHKIIYFWSPKCGCTTIKAFHFSLNKISLIEYHENVHELPIVAIEDLGKYQDYQKILFIRNPLSRLVSFLFQKFLPNLLEIPYNPQDLKSGSEQEEILTINKCVAQFLTLSDEACKDRIISLLYAAYISQDKTAKIPESIQIDMLKFKQHPSFRNLINIIIQIPDIELENHVGPQSINSFEKCPPVEQIKFDRIINLEYLTQELERINKLFGNKAIIQKLNSVRRNLHFDRNLSNENIFSYLKQYGFLCPDWKIFYDKELIQIVETKFNKDFALYKHSFLYSPIPAPEQHNFSEKSDPLQFPKSAAGSAEKKMEGESFISAWLPIKKF